MKCAYHPKESSVATCSVCQKALCEECAGQEVEGKIVCTRCAALSAAHDASVLKAQKQEKQDERRSALSARKKRKSRAVMGAILLFALIVLLANGYMYFGTRGSRVAEFDPNADLELTALIVNDGIEEYAADHGGKFPDSLTAIHEGYLSKDGLTLQVLNQFSYLRHSPQSYELRLKDPDHEQYPDILFKKEVE